MFVNPDLDSESPHLLENVKFKCLEWSKYLVRYMHLCTQVCVTVFQMGVKTPHQTGDNLYE